jgi:transcriptional regulator with PAS, ATPase and Fis domain
MTKNLDPHETVVEDGSLTLPPPPSATTTVTGEVLVDTEPEPTDPATAFGVELADGQDGASRRAFLVIHEGHEGRVLEVPDGQEISFGRSSSTTIVVDDPRVSRHHARIVRRGHILMCEDMASRNGTKVNGASFRNARRMVVSGDVMRVGSAEVIVASAIRGADDEDDGSIGVAVGDAKMRQVFALAKQLAGGDTPVLVQGDPGVGKKVVASQIHRWSARGAQPFVRIDCANLPDMLLEGALFGFEGGGDAKREIGHLEAANGGTLLLDGVAELSASAQARLMTALETRRITRIGGDTEVPIDVRVLGATHRDLPAEVAAKRFREDLYYRISAFTLRVPPLRERHAEIDLFAHLFALRFAAKIGQPSPFFVEDAATQLLRYEWPENVRELRDAVRHAVSACKAGRIDLESLPEAARKAQRPSVRTRA